MRFRWAIAITSGLLLALAYPGFRQESCIWLWLHPLLGSLWLGQVSKRKALLLGYLAGLAFFGVSLAWVRHSSRVINGAYGDEWMGFGVEAMGWGAVVGLCIYLALYFAAWAVLAATVAKPRTAVLQQGSWVEASLESIRCALLAACSWVLLEWMRSWMLTGFGWNSLGVALYRNKAMIQAADLVGVTGLSFTPVFLSGVAFCAVHRIVLQTRMGKRLRWHFDLFLAIALLCAQMIYGMIKLAAPAAPSVPVRVALVQLNIPQVDLWQRRQLAESYQRFADFTRLYGEKRPGDDSSPVDLIVWSESALQLPFRHPDHPKFFNDLLSLGNFSLMTGTDFERTETGPARTSCALLQGSYETAQVHHKVHLVPFGEYLPLRHTLPVMQAMFGSVLPGDFLAGTSTEPLVLDHPKVQLMPLICFEDTVGSLARQFVRPQPQLIVNMTNDGWFLHSVQPEQHLANALLRAVELRRPMVRCCNTGITCAIDERGRILAELRDHETGSPFVEGVLPATVQVPLAGEITLFAKWGDWFAWLCAIVTLLATALHLRRRRAEASRARLDTPPH